MFQRPDPAPRAVALRDISRRFYVGALGGALCLLAAGCASERNNEDSFLGLITPYRVEVVQGNVVTQEMVAELKAGLSREQVRLLLGSPLLADIFHGDRWDYVFSIRRQGTQYQQRRVTVYFKADRVVGFDADQLPAERDFVTSIDVKKPTRAAPPLELTDEQLRTLPLPKPGADAAVPALAAASGPQRAYPPLEPLAR
jgi:outer membrane protein assembly factor BamE